MSSVVDRKSLHFRWCRLGPRCEERGGVDVVTSLTTSDAADRSQWAPALRVAGGEPASASLPLLSDVTASPASRRLASAGSAPATKDKGFSVHHTSCDVSTRCSLKGIVHPGDFGDPESLPTNRSHRRSRDGHSQECAKLPRESSAAGPARGGRRMERGRCGARGRHQPKKVL